MGLFKPRYAEGQELDVGGVVVRLQINRRARRVSLRLDPRSGAALAIAPSVALLGAAVDFARNRRDWLGAQQARVVPAPETLACGDTLTVMDEIWRLAPDGRRPRLTPPLEDGIRVLRGCGAGEVDAGLVARAVRREAACAFEARVAAHCESLGVATPGVRTIDARTRWGSCTPARAGRGPSIRISWRLALAPFHVADYVAAHECAHLLEANHGPRFWALVEGLVPDLPASRAWLRAEGAGLFRRLAGR